MQFDPRTSVDGGFSPAVSSGPDAGRGCVKTVRRLSVLALGCLLALAGEAQADPLPCFGAWFAIPFVDGPAVCGDASVAGADLLGAPMSSTVNPTNHAQSSVGVVVGVVGTGLGAFGSTAANGTFGDLSFHADAHMTLPAPGVGYYSHASIRSMSSLGFVDGFTVTTGQTVRITSAVSGAFTGGASQADVDFFLQKDAPPGNAPTIIIYTDANAFIYSGFPSSRFVRDVFLAPGTYSFRWAMQVQATASVEGGGLYVDATADTAHQGRLFFDPLTPGSPLTFLSGRSYVPEPGVWAMLGAGLAGLGIAGRRRRAVATLATSSRSRAPGPRAGTGVGGSSSTTTPSSPTWVVGPPA